MSLKSEMEMQFKDKRELRGNSALLTMEFDFKYCRSTKNEE